MNVEFKGKFEDGKSKIESSSQFQREIGREVVVVFAIHKPDLLFRIPTIVIPQSLFAFKIEGNFPMSSIDVAVILGFLYFIGI